MKDFDEWWFRYKRWIIVMREPSKVLRHRPQVGLTVTTRTTRLYLPHYTGGGWQDGRPWRHTLGDQPALVRLPALRIKDRYFLLDGSHRLKAFRPAFVLVDWVEYAKGEQVQWMDMYNVYWQRWAK